MRIPSPADLAQEARTSLRVLLRAPMLSTAIVLTVGLGIGATTAIFAGVDTALVRPLPYAQPDRLVWIYTDAPPFRFRFSAVDYLALEAQQTQFESVAAYTERSMAFSSGSSAELLGGRVVSTSYFKVLGIAMALGRDFTPAEDSQAAPPR